MRLPSILLVLAAAPVTAAAQPSADTTASAIDRFIRARAVADSFSGSVLVAHNGVPVLRAGYGLADRDKRAPVTPETKFNLGSIDKLITRIAIWQLVAAGKLDLDAPVGRYLADYPNTDVRERVTARQLYQMRSGIGDFFGDEFRRRHDQIRTVDDYLSLFAHEPLRFAPGTGMLYSNGGYIVLGKLIEKLSGQSYYDYVLARITGPAGMHDTQHYLLDERVPGRAIGYTAMRGPLGPNTGSLAGRGSPAGGGYSTVDDFLELDSALRAGTLIPAAFADSILTPRFRTGGSDPLNYGGGGPGTNTQYVAYPDGWTIIVFANRDPSAATTVAQGIARILGKTLPGGTRVLRRPGE
jgi:CubicO group peptidase (beta-lactamase class C family)